ncbi:YCF48-related protein [Pseudoduganella sp. UC29_106]|uniref:WD40/YVTN/BNR-like repeat-containing protein n=1 Tax=Pseudoduganella sp. UC29_106 TaxID=3374553 RepID=UPI0037581E5A
MATTEGVPLLAAARAGNRVVAVGDHGAVLLSDDGATFRQAKSVPARSTLTSVIFVDGQQGYAAGHDGVVLGTLDGGETWTLLRAAAGREQPILSLHFDSLAHGIAIGLYGWAIETRDGGHTWSELRIANGDDADRHLLHIFASGAGTLFIAGEAGAIFRSSDGGKSWQPLSTGNKGSLWYGRALADGTLLVCGMRGHLYRSSDDGQTWQAVQSHTTQSLTGIAEQADGSVVVVGMAGTVLRSTDSGRSFTLSERPGREPLTAVLGGEAKPLLLSMAGQVR